MTERDERALHGVRVKLVRARDQLDLLDREINAFGNTNLGTGRPTKRDLDGLKWTVPLKLREPFPLRWSVIVGEIVHDLRSALDHAVYQLTLDYAGIAYERTQFPIITNPTAWDVRSTKSKHITPDNPSGYVPNCAVYSIRGVGSGVRDYIERLQPYPTNKAQSGAVRALSALHETWNQDKHRLIHYWGVEIRQDLSQFEVVGTAAAYTVEFADGVIQDGDDMVTVTFQQPPGQCEFESHPIMQIAFNDPADPGNVGENPLWRIYDTTVMIVSALLVAVGNQDEPIP